MGTQEPIRIDAPSALLGFFLALRLQGCDAHVVGSEKAGWSVEIARDAPREFVLDCVQRWLDDEALTRVVVHIDGVDVALSPRKRPA
ncbi:MAG: hypothetical protein JO017_08835 [Actinobacteria bacterium]|nr:hypothetical protein [Actinomycetota bacterium]